MKDSLYRVYTTVINQDRLEKILDAEKAKNFHRMIQVLRHKFGPIDFCIPYEFNSTDLDVALIYSEKF
jgi:dynein heavy chain